MRLNILSKYKRRILLMTLMLAALLASGCESSNTGAVDKSEKKVTETDSTTEKDSEGEKSEEALEEDTQELAAAEEPVDQRYKEVYAELVKECSADNDGQEFSGEPISFDLIYLDEDKIPELVVGLNGYWVSMYTYENGQIYPLMDGWPYGAMGNNGYEYYPEQGIIYNRDSDFAGLMEYHSLQKFDKKTHSLVDLYDEDLHVIYTEDINGDGTLDLEEAENAEYDENGTYYYGNKIISKDEFDSYINFGKSENVYGRLDAQTILNILGGEEEYNIEAANEDDDGYDLVDITRQTYYDQLYHYLNDSSYETGEYLLDGVGDAMAHEDGDIWYFALKDFNRDGIDELLITPWLEENGSSCFITIFTMQEDELVNLGSCFGFFDEQRRILDRVYGINGADELCDSFYEFSGNELVFLRGYIDMRETGQDYVAVYSDDISNYDQLITADEALSHRPEPIRADFMELTPANIDKALK